MSVYVDTDANSNYLWPTGTSLTTSQKQLTMTTLNNIIGSTDVPNELEPDQVRYGCRLVNNSADTHTYYVYVRFLFIRQGVLAPVSIG